MNSNWLSSTYTFQPNLDAYFSRINYSGSREPTVETLKQIQWNHLLTVPFEDLDVYLKGRIDLEPELIQEKIVFNRRGGYCYENNILLMHVLRAMGYDVTPILSRTIWQKPSDIISPPTHLILKVKIDGVLWMFDVGFSSFGTPYPLEIETDREQPTPLETRRIQKVDTGYIHQMYSQGKWNDIFIFTLTESYPFDWEIGSYWVSTNPKSFCLLHIIVSMPTENCRYLLLNRILSTRYLDGTSESQEITSEDKYFEILRDIFKLEFPVGTRLCPPNIAW